MIACVTYAFHQESLQNVQYLACNMVECTILERWREYFQKLVDVENSKRKEEMDSKQK